MPLLKTSLHKRGKEIKKFRQRKERKKKESKKKNREKAQ